MLPLQWAQLTKTVHTARLGLEFVFLCFSGCMIYLYVHVCFVLPWTVESFFFMLWRWRNKLKWASFELFALSSLPWVRSWLHPFKGYCEQKAMRDEGVIYVAGHPLQNRRCTRLPGCIRRANLLATILHGLYPPSKWPVLCRVEGIVKLCSLEHSPLTYIWQHLKLNSNQSINQLEHSVFLLYDNSEVNRQRRNSVTPNVSW